MKAIGALLTVILPLAGCASPPINDVLSGDYPAYPRAALVQGIYGTVVVWIYVQQDGTVRDVVVKESPHELLSEQVISTLRTWKFKPASEAFIKEYRVTFNFPPPSAADWRDQLRDRGRRY